MRDSGRTIRNMASEDLQVLHFNFFLLKKSGFKKCMIPMIQINIFFEVRIQIAFFLKVGSGFKFIQITTIVKTLESTENGYIQFFV